MQHNYLIVLTQLLRQFGFEISVDQAIDVARVLTLVDSLLELKIAVRSIVVKSPEQIKLFDFVFDQYIAKTTSWEKTLEELKHNALNEWGIKPQSKFKPRLGNNPACPNPIGGAAIGAGTGLATVSGLTKPETLLSFHSDFKFIIKKMINESIDEAADTLVTRYLLAMRTNFNEVMHRKEKALKEIRHVLENQFPSVANHVSQLFEKAVNQKLIEHAKESPKDTFALYSIEERDFFELEETPELREALKKMAQRLAVKRKRRLIKGPRKINMRKTIRHNIQNGGVPINLIRAEPRKRKPKLIVLTDVSPSTIYATKLFLMLLWELKEMFDSVRFYEFVGSCIDVTDAYVDGKSLYESVNAALEKWSNTIGGKQSSNYERALSDFLKMAKSRLDPDTTVLLLGDLRDWLGSRIDGFPLSVKSMKIVKQLSKKFFVLNPEPRRYWNTADSIVSYVKAIGVEVYEVTNLIQLENILSEIIIS